MVADITTTLNFVFQHNIILILGLWVYRIKRYIYHVLALAFGIFSVSYLEVLLGISNSNVSVVFLIVLASLVIIYTP